MWTVVFARRSPTTSSGDHLSNSCARSERKRPVTHSSTLTTPGLIAQISHLRMLARTDTVRLELGIDEHIGHLPSPRDREPAPAVWTHRTSARASAPHPPANTPAPHGPPPPDRSRQGPPASRNTTAAHGAPGPDEGSELHRPEPDGTRVSTQPGTALGALLQQPKAPDRLPARGPPETARTTTAVREARRKRRVGIPRCAGLPPGPIDSGAGGTFSAPTAVPDAHAAATFRRCKRRGPSRS